MHLFLSHTNPSRANKVDKRQTNQKKHKCSSSSTKNVHLFMEQSSISFKKGRENRIKRRASAGLVTRTGQKARGANAKQPLCNINISYPKARDLQKYTHTRIVKDDDDDECKSYEQREGSGRNPKRNRLWTGKQKRKWKNHRLEEAGWMCVQLHSFLYPLLDADDKMS